MEFLKRNDIDTDRWDAVISSSETGIPYAYTTILDECCGGKWDAIVGDGYSYVLPLPFNRKILGFKQYFQPYLLQQLGIFGDIPGMDELKDILGVIKRHSVRSLMAFQEENTQLLKGSGILKTNFVLDLKASYEDISQQYKKSLKQRVGKDYDDTFLGREEIRPDEALEMYIQWTYTKYSRSEKLSRQYIRNWVQAFDRLGYLDVIALKTNHSTIHSGIIYLKTPSRIILSLQFNHPEYKNFSGPSRLIDRLIRQHAGQEIALDFEGSEIPSIAEFYSSFSPENKPYTIVRT